MKLFRFGVAIALLLTGCSPAAKEASTTDTVATASAPVPAITVKNPKVEPDGELGKYGGTLHLYAYEDPKTLNPMLTQDSVSQRFTMYTFEGLVDEDGITLEVEPALAESWTVSPDNKTYVFTLREGLQWSDGHPLTADDVVFTFNDIIANPKIPASPRDTIQVDGKLPTVKKLDDRRVEISTSKVFAPFLRNIGGVQIMPKHVLAELVKKLDKGGSPVFNTAWGMDADIKKIVGNGPWLYDEYQPAQRFIFRRNPNYWRVNKAGQPLPYFDKMEVPFLKNVDTAILKFNAGEHDAQWLRGKDYPLMKPQEKSGNFTIVNGGPDWRISYFEINLSTRKDKNGKWHVPPKVQKWLQDKRFRKALAHALDRQSITRNVWKNMAVEQPGPIFQKSPYFDDAAVVKYPYDLAKAEQLLTEAGFKKGADGKLRDSENNAVQLELITETGSPEQDLEVNTFKGDLKKLGIELRVQPMNFNNKIDKLESTHDWQIVNGAFGVGVDPYSSANLWKSNGRSHSFNHDVTAKKAHTPWEARIDEIYEETATTLDEAKRQKLFSEFQHIVTDEVPMIFRPVFLYLVAVRNSLGNARPSAFSTLGTSWNSYELYRK